MCSNQTYRLEDLTLRLNVFETKAPAKNRLIGVHNGKRSEKILEFNVSQGDRAEGSSRRDQSLAWKLIPLRS
jgi:hypothetical protein